MILAGSLCPARLVTPGIGTSYHLVFLTPPPALGHVALLIDVLFFFPLILCSARGFLFYLHHGAARPRQVSGVSEK